LRRFRFGWFRLRIAPLIGAGFVIRPRARSLLSFDGRMLRPADNVLRPVIGTGNLDGRRRRWRRCLGRWPRRLDIGRRGLSGRRRQPVIERWMIRMCTNCNSGNDTADHL
jgi:hypothetical protein